MHRGGLFSPQAGLLYGAHREALIGQIDEAIEMLQDEPKPGGLQETMRVNDKHLKNATQNQ